MSIHGPRFLATWEEDTALYIMENNDTSMQIKAEEFSKAVGRTFSRNAFQRQLRASQAGGRVAPDELPVQTRHLLPSKRLGFGKPRGRVLSDWTAEDLRLLRDCFNSPALSTSSDKVKAEQYRTLSGSNRREDFIIAGYEALEGEEEANDFKFCTIWPNTFFSPEERIPQLNSLIPKQAFIDSRSQNRTDELDASKHQWTVEEAATTYSTMVEKGTAHALWPPAGVFGDGDLPNVDGTWEEHEVKFFIDRWLPMPVNARPEPMKQMWRDLLGFSGNDRSLSSAENKWRQVTGVVKFEHRDLYQHPAALDAESLFRKHDYMPKPFSRLEDNVLRRIGAREYQNDPYWEQRTKDCKAETKLERSATELYNRYTEVIKTQEPHGDDPEAWVPDPSLLYSGDIKPR